MKSAYVLVNTIDGRKAHHRRAGCHVGGGVVCCSFCVDIHVVVVVLVYEITALPWAICSRGHEECLWGTFTPLRLGMRIGEMPFAGFVLDIRHSELQQTI